MGIVFQRLGCLLIQNIFKLSGNDQGREMLLRSRVFLAEWVLSEIRQRFREYGSGHDEVDKEGCSFCVVFIVRGDFRKSEGDVDEQTSVGVARVRRAICGVYRFIET